jgi:hypothetical protein
MQSFKAGKITVCCDPLTPCFDGESREPSILNQVSGSIRMLTQVSENAPMTVPGLNDLTMGLLQ